MTTPTTGTRVARLTGVALAICVATLGVAARPADGAGHRSEPARGVREVTINSTAVVYLGGYRLTGVSRANAFSVGPGVGAADGTYTGAKPTVDSPRLDALLFMLETGLIASSDDRAIAAAALTWWYADARRPDGSAVWSDASAQNAAIGPRQPHDWTQLAAYSGKFPIGIKGQGVDFDVAERELVALDATAQRFVGPWTLRLVGSDTVRLEANGRPLPGVPVFYTPPQTTPPSDVEPAPALMTTDDNGEIDVTEIRGRWEKWAADQDGKAKRDGPDDGPIGDAPDGSVRFIPDKVWVDAPGRHAEWVSDGGGARLATATVERLGQELVLDDRFPVTTTTSTTTTAATTSTTVVSSTTTTVASDATTTTDGPTSSVASTTTSTTTPGSGTESTTTGPPTQSTATPEVAPPSPGGSSGGSGTGSGSPIPVTGPSRVLGWILRFGDVIILVGVALVVGAEYLPQRKETTAP